MHTDTIAETHKQAYRKINADIFNFNMVKPMCSDWVEDTIVLPDSTSRYPGHFSYRWTPYMIEPLNRFHPSDPTRYVAIMKCVQSGATAGLVIPLLCYIIDQNPDNILFTGGDLLLAAKTIEERLDPILRASGLIHNIRPNVIKKTNNRSGDTSKKKEFAGGTLTALGTNSANSFRFFSAKYFLGDDWDTAPRNLGNEGSPKKLVEGRQNSYGNMAKSCFISTPTVKGLSNIEDEFYLGTQKHWNWPCPECGVYFPLDFKIDCADGTIGGLVWQLDEKNKLILSSVKLRCPHCGNLISEQDKYDLNLQGKWIATVDKPAVRNYESYLIPGLALPPGFTDWIKLAEEWLEANPPGDRVNVDLLRSFNNLRLGLPFAEAGFTPRINKLMLNTREYQPGIIPDATCERDGNGKIIMLTLASDLNGIMNDGLEDVRLDWELLAHSSTGVTYSVDHGSVGTFKRAHTRTGYDKENESARVKWTATHNVKNSIWPEFEKILRAEYPLESGSLTPALSGGEGVNKTRQVDITVIDTGFSEKLCMQFVQDMYDDAMMCFGIKGRTENNYRPVKRDSNPVVRSKERPRVLYIAEVNQIKDDLSNNIELREGEDGSQPGGFMNFPQTGNGKYDFKNYFSHYEGEHREEVKNKAGSEVIGFTWKKKNNDVQNHFWDVRVYNLCAPLVYLDVFKQMDPAKYKNFSWEDFVLLLCE